MTKKECRERNHLPEAYTKPWFHLQQRKGGRGRTTKAGKTSKERLVHTLWEGQLPSRVPGGEVKTEKRTRTKKVWNGDRAVFQQAVNGGESPRKIGETCAWQKDLF